MNDPTLMDPTMRYANAKQPLQWHHDPTEHWTFNSRCPEASSSIVTSWITNDRDQKQRVWHSIAPASHDTPMERATTNTTFASTTRTLATRNNSCDFLACYFIHLQPRRLSISTSFRWLCSALAIVMLQHSMPSLSQSQSRVAHLESNVPPPAIENMNGKTPARGGASNPHRRAFGDISNRKGLRPHPSTLKNVLDGKTPNLIPTIDLETHVKPKYDPSTLKEQKILSKTKEPQELRRVGNVQFTLPDPVDRTDRPSKTTVRSNTEAQTVFKAPSFFDIPPDELEIEHPAGRLYDDQLSFDWDDDPSASLMEGATTFRQEWIDTVEELHEYKLQMREQKIEESIRNMDKLALQDLDGTCY
jgi:hypothetical protein